MSYLCKCKPPPIIVLFVRLVLSSVLPEQLYGDPWDWAALDAAEADGGHDHGHDHGHNHEHSH